jgi:hypothetical protein
LDDEASGEVERLSDWLERIVTELRDQIAPGRATRRYYVANLCKDITSIVADLRRLRAEA